MEKQRPKVVVVGFGNLLLKDEGVGIHVIHALQEMALPQDSLVEIMDGGTSTDILASLPAADKLVIVDAAAGGGEPGTIYQFIPEDIGEGEGMVASLHQSSLGLSLKIMKYVGMEPGEVLIIGIEPKEIDWGLKLSSKLQRRMPCIIDLILKETGISRQSLPIRR